MTSPGKASTCPTCHVQVFAIRVPYLSTPVLLDDHELPITANLDALVPEAKAWRFLGPRIGWEPLHVAARDWRPIRGTHQCPGNHENENKKENRK